MAIKIDKVTREATCYCNAKITIPRGAWEVECPFCRRTFNFAGQSVYRNWSSEADDYRNEG